MVDKGLSASEYKQLLKKLSGDTYPGLSNDTESSNDAQKNLISDDAIASINELIERADRGLSVLNKKNVDSEEEEDILDEGDDEREEEEDDEEFEHAETSDIGDDNEEATDDEDEWENDDDTGVFMITLSEDAFFEMEESSAASLTTYRNSVENAHNKKVINSVNSIAIVSGGQEDSTNDQSQDVDSVESSTNEDQEEFDTDQDSDDYEDDVLAVTAMLNKGTLRAETEAANNEALPVSVQNLADCSSILLPPPPPEPVPIPTSATETKNIASKASDTSAKSATDSYGKFGNINMNQQTNRTIRGQHMYRGCDGRPYGSFNLRIVFEPYKTGFEEGSDNQNYQPAIGTLIAGRYEVDEVLGTAAFSTALQCADVLCDENGSDPWVCLKVIKHGKDYFDQSLDEIKLLQYINTHADPDEKHVLRLIDFFYAKERLFLVTELLRENLYEFGKAITESNQLPYFVLPRLKLIAKQVLEALAYVHSLGLIHCDIKPENIVMKSYSKCLVKLIDFGSSCFTTDKMSTYIQSRSYRAPEVIIGHPYDGRIDVWSVGAVIAEMYSGYVLFQNDSVQTMLARISGIVGPFPPTLINNGKDSARYFTMSNVVYDRIPNADNSVDSHHSHESPTASPSRVSKDEADNSGFVLIYPKKTTLEARLHMPKAKILDGNDVSSSEAETAEEKENRLFVAFVRSLLTLNPFTRPTAEQALCHEWLRGADDFDLKRLNDEEGRWEKAQTTVPEDDENVDDDDEDTEALDMEDESR